MRLILIAIAIGTAILAATSGARAERVAIVEPDPADDVLLEAFNRLRAELVLHHFEVEVVSAALNSAPEDTLAVLARRAGAVAGIAFIHHGSSASVDVWLVDRVSGKTTIRRLDVGRARDAASVLAIRAVDLLRASFEEFAPGEEPPPEIVDVERRPMSSAVRRLQQPPPREASHHAVSIEGFALFDGPRLGLCYGPALGFEWRLGHLELWAHLAGPLIGARLETERGSATSRQELAWFEARYPWRVAHGFEAGLGLGFGAHFLQAQGQPEPPLTSRSDAIWGFFGSVGAHARLHLGSTTALVFSLRALELIPRQGVAILEQRALLAEPMLSGSLGASVGL